MSDDDDDEALIEDGRIHAEGCTTLALQGGVDAMRRKSLELPTTRLILVMYLVEVLTFDGSPPEVLSAPMQQGTIEDLLKIKCPLSTGVDRDDSVSERVFAGTRSAVERGGKLRDIYVSLRCVLTASVRRFVAPRPSGSGEFSLICLWSA